MHEALLYHVRTVLRRYHLDHPEVLLLVAVSGGPDSLVLLHLLTKLRAQGGSQLHVAHLDHGIRPEAAAEAQYVATLAATWGVPATFARRDVPALAKAHAEGLPAAARRARYHFLASTAMEIGAGAVVVAHQADDQAETVLLHLLRGAGLAGLRGMREAVPWDEWAPSELSRSTQDAPALLRPLLAIPREQLLAYATHQGLEPVDDPSNRAERYARTRIRQLLPILANENPQLVAALGRTARVVADDYAFIQSQLDHVWPDLATVRAGFVALQRERLLNLPLALQRQALRRAAEHLGVTDLSLTLIETAREAMYHVGRQFQLGHALALEVEYATLLLSQPGYQQLADVPQLSNDEIHLPIPGVVELGNGWWCFVQEEPPAEPDAWWVALDADRLAGSLILRRRRAGDRFRPVGGPGSRKVQDFMVDRKLPRRLRDGWPLLVTPTAIVWLAGMRADERFLASPTTQRTIWVGLVS
ncbi:tRNA lysidine(34) synthetase TilS [Candidatus Chloroploca sp. M-50]|uniref:tRNA(Ile)-lysidine synthase n=1 Tax=Candidatus Chloroploca mongolica TaxID=2528176 RepID=A0ABS4D877_9CHLR|nr:tRNA lysidine(34) synthetase TilS [Candidatus Chloroploca mongolica]MBP1465649.1 tRNA lysidine(34) synthetase TilS [Candidatus Chloroploca mongolica]